MYCNGLFRWYFCKVLFLWSEKFYNVPSFCTLVLWYLIFCDLLQYLSTLFWFDFTLVSYTKTKKFISYKVCYLNFLGINHYSYFCQIDCVKSIGIWSFSGPYFPAFGPEKLRVRTYFTQCYSYEHQRRIQNPIKYLKRNSLRK